VGSLNTDPEMLWTVGELPQDCEQSFKTAMTLWDTNWVHHHITLGVNNSNVVFLVSPVNTDIVHRYLQLFLHLKLERIVKLESFWFQQESMSNPPQVVEPQPEAWPCAFRSFKTSEMLLPPIWWFRFLAHSHKA
jgi:hypothetical protein